MTWGWAVRGDNLGTPAESAVKETWPDYNAEYLKKKLNGQKRRFAPGALDDIEKQVYLQQSVKGYEAEAEACLKEEFKQWLQGTHEANVADEMGMGYYVNNDDSGGPKRRHVYDGVVSAELADNGAQGTGWRATRWGTKQLTHLDGVRDFLRAGRIQQDNAERDMNLLAERGPQDLNEAWMYFKHWVKKRPVTTCDDSGPSKQKNDLSLHQVDRMNGTGPSNWNSRTNSDPATPGWGGAYTPVVSSANRIKMGAPSSTGSDYPEFDHERRWSQKDGELREKAVNLITPNYRLPPNEPESAPGRRDERAWVGRIDLGTPEIERASSALRAAKVAMSQDPWHEVGYAKLGRNRRLETWAPPTNLQGEILVDAMSPPSNLHGEDILVE